VTILLAMTSNASPELLTELYVAYFTGLVRLAELLLDEPATCEDVVQEAYIRAAAAKGRLRDPDASLAYLRRTVVNLSRWAMRRRLVATRYLSRNLPESTVSDGSPSQETQPPFWAVLLFRASYNITIPPGPATEDLLLQAANANWQGRR
jgi:DNA-directed RNA polymerase specialized sigma24 family protein